MNRILLLNVCICLLVPWTFISAQQINVEGSVTASDNNESLIGVNVVIKGSTTGTITDFEGHYMINAPVDAILVFSYVGYNPVEIPVNNRTRIDVALEPAFETLSEIVVVGYGTQRREDLTSSIAILDPRETLKMPGGVLQTIQGQVAGVQVTDNRVRIRGTGSVNDTDPLWVVDGFIDGAIPNENEIESIQILKDAAATAIYGARGSNGVIIVTTKRGQPGPTKIEYHSYFGTKNAWKQLDLLDAQEMAELANEAVYNYRQQFPERPIRYVDAYRNPDSLGIGTNWQEAWFRRGNYHNHYLAVSGGNENSRFRVSANYATDKDIIISQNTENLSLFITSEHKKGILTLGEAFTISNENRIENNNPITEVWRMTPNIPIYDENNLGGYAGPELKDGHDMYNPIGLANLIDDERQDVNIKGNLWVNAELLKGLNYRFNFGYDRGSGLEYYYTSRYRMGAQRINDISKLRETSRWNQRFLYENTLTFDRQFGRHNFTILAGVTSENYHQRFIRGYGENFPLDNIRVLNAAESGIIANGNEEEWAMFSLLGRINYGFDGKYLLTANVRRDKSSRFSASNRVGIFPSISAAWRVSEEDFIKNAIPVISDLKLRASYGLIGNDRVPLYGYESFLDMAQFYIFNNERAVAYLPMTFGTTGLKWETVYSTDIGLDLGLFNQKLIFTFDYFDNTTEDMLIRVPIPLSSGIDGSANAPFLNAGSINNKGLEFALIYRNNINRLFYSVGANLTTVQNKVIKLGEQGEPIASGLVQPNPANVTRTEEGGSVGAFYGFVTDGLYQNWDEIDPDFAPNAAPGDIRFKDLNGDGSLSEDDRAFIGSPIPDFSFGLSTDLSYRGWDFSMLVQGDYGHQIYNQGKYFTENMQHYSNNAAVTLDRWRGEDLLFVHPNSGVETFYPKNTDTDMPRAALNDPNRNIQRISDRYIEDGSYLRIKRMTLGYTLPENVSSRIHTSNLRVYIGAKNLLTITKYSGYDPEVGDRGDANAPYNLNRGIDVQSPFLGTGISSPGYPVAREFFVGIQASF